MEVKKMLDLSDDEFMCLVQAGDIIGTIDASLENNKINVVSSAAHGLLQAMYVRLDRILSNNVEE